VRVDRAEGGNSILQQYAKPASKAAPSTPPASAPQQPAPAVPAKP
jgi:hypothetical protein